MKHTQNCDRRRILVLEEINFQANLLALQASVELAGAEPKSSEMALAAHEVRQLALRGVSAAKASPGARLKHTS